MIEEIKIKNFRSWKDEKVSFKPNMNLIIGENDSGKTTLLDALSIMFNKKTLEIMDIRINENATEFILKMNIVTIKVSYNRDDISKPMKEYVFKKEYLEEQKTILQTLDDMEEIKKLGLIINEKITAAIREVDRAKSKITTKIDELIVSGNPVEDSTILQKYNFQYLDGKTINDINQYVNEAYINNFCKEIWNEKVENATITVKEYVEKRFANHINNVRTTLNEVDNIQNFKKYNNNINRLDIAEPNVQFASLKCNTSISIVGNDNNPIEFNKLGDGTKRRITLSLFEINSKEETRESIYLFDEPDTHLHVKAQCELLEIFKKILDKQIIITTHSPFIINSVSTDRISLVRKDEDTTKIQSISDEGIEEILQELGVENINLFFARKILLVEGDTEVNFIEGYFKEYHKSNLKNRLIKVINIEGISNSCGFARAIKELGLKDCTKALFDTDMKDSKSDIETIIRELNFEENKDYYLVGEKEFEDAFDTEDIYKALLNYKVDKDIEQLLKNLAKSGLSDSDIREKIEEKKGNVKMCDKFTKDAINDLKNKCKTDNNKFSAELIELTSGTGTKYTKPIIGRALAKYVDREKYDEKIVKILEFLEK
ncbi:MAG: AAA family ATPase [Clostridia bacterium]|nr:AAA family ATPase [Clostridia bacterium]MDD4387027.1 AAA family ATPase [Clostridia bacterium]